MCYCDIHVHICGRMGIQDIVQYIAIVQLLHQIQNLACKSYRYLQIFKTSSLITQNILLHVLTFLM